MYIFKKLKKLCNIFLKKDNIVLKDWVLVLTLKQQCGLRASIRGTDKDNGTCKISKNITKMLRYLILKNADKKQSFMTEDVIKAHNITDFLAKEYPYNKHWVEHILTTSFNIKQNHPNNYVRAYWGEIALSLTFKIKEYKKEHKKQEKINRIYEKYIDIYIKRGI